MDESVVSEREFTADERCVLVSIYECLKERGDWPTYDEVDDLADRVGGVADPLATMRTLTPLFVLGIGSAGEPSDTQPVKLSLLGLNAVARWNVDAKSDLARYVGSVRAAVELADATELREDARFNGLRFMTDVVPGNPHVSEVARLGQIWTTVGYTLCKNFSGGGSVDWVATLNRRGIRDYRTVRTVDDLLAVERQRLAADAAALAAWEQQGVAPTQPTSAAGSGSNDLPEWASLLPELFRHEVADALVSRPADAISAGWKALANLIYDKTGIDSDGYDLVNKAFGAKAAVRLGSNSTTGNNLHDGYTDLMRGLVRMRNVHSHRGHHPVTDLHAAAVILALGDCYSVVLQLPDCVPNTAHVTAD